MEMTAQPGGIVQPTVDCFTRPGSVTLVNEDPKQLEADYQTLHKLTEEASLVFLPFFIPTCSALPLCNFIIIHLRRVCLNWNR